MILGILKYLALMPVHIIATIISYIVVPFAVLLASEDGWLPKYLWWFQTWDNPLDGDDNWKKNVRLWRNDPDVETNKYKRYINRILWLYRNPVYGFEKSILCAKITPQCFRECKGDITIGGIPTRFGWFLLHIKTKEGRNYTEFMLIKKISDKKFFNMILGWKLSYAPQFITEQVNIQICTTVRTNDIKY